MKSKKPIKSKLADTASLGHVLKKNEKIKDTVEEAADELGSVNKKLKQKKASARTKKLAVDKNEEVEQKVAEAAENLTLVNAELAEEIAERKLIESELADTKSDLAEARDDLSSALKDTEKAQLIALQDSLTGLHNRLAYEQHLEHGMLQATRYGWALAVLFIDIDKFKSVNDSYGHDVGDRVLLMVADRLKSFVRAEDIVSRWGGDEFVCLFFDVKRELDAQRLTGEIKARIAEPFEFNGIVLSVTVSIGFSMYPADGRTAEVLFKKADTAMYQGKTVKERVIAFEETGEQTVI